jgi:hypothetical protein
MGGPEHRQNIMGGPEHRQNIKGGPEHRRNIMGGPEHRQNIMGGPEHRQNDKEQNGENLTFIRKRHNINTAANQKIAIDLGVLESLFNPKWGLCL